MRYKVDTIAPFRRAAKKLIKKYPSLKDELEDLGTRLSKDPTTGTALGNNCYKIRLAIASKGKRQIRRCKGGLEAQRLVSFFVFGYR